MIQQKFSGLKKFAYGFAVIVLMLTVTICYNITSAMHINAADSNEDMAYDLATFSNAATTYMNAAMAEGALVLGAGWDKYTGPGFLGYQDKENGAFNAYGVGVHDAQNGMSYSYDAINTIKITGTPYRFQRYNGELFEGNAVNGSPYDGSATVSDAGAQLINTYCAAGATIQALGLSDTGDDALSASMRMLLGSVAMIVYVLAASLNTFLKFAMEVASKVNPFEVIDGISVTGGSGGINAGIATFINTVGGTIGGYYHAMKEFSLAVLLPIVLVVGIFSWMMSSTIAGRSASMNFWQKMRYYIAFAFFLVTFIPLAAATYQEIIHNVSISLDNGGIDGSSCIMSTFCDFEGWAMDSNFEGFYDASIVGNYGSAATTSGGHINITPATSEIVKARSYCFKVNEKANLHRAGTDTNKVDMTGMIAPTGTGYGEAASNAVQNPVTGSSANNVSSGVIHLLQRFARGDKIGSAKYATRYAPAESITYNEALFSSKWYRYDPQNPGPLFQEMGPTDTTQTPFPDTGAGSAMSLIMNRLNTSFGGTIWKVGGTGDHLSTMAAYNYMNSTFGATGMTVYSPTSSSSDYVNHQHFSVSLVGTGFLKYVFYLDSLALVIAITILGYAYGIGMMFANFQAIFKLIGSVFAGLWGSMRGIATSFAILFTLIVNVVVSVGMFDIAYEVISKFYNGIGEAVTQIITSVLPTTIGSYIPFMLTVVVQVGFLCIIVRKFLDWKKAITAAVAEAFTAVINKVLGTNAAAPNLQMSDGALEAAAGLGLGAAMAYNQGAFDGALGDQNKLAGESTTSENIGGTMADSNTENSEFGVNSGELHEGDSSVDANSATSLNPDEQAEAYANEHERELMGDQGEYADGAAGDGINGGTADTDAYGLDAENADADALAAEGEDANAGDAENADGTAGENALGEDGMPAGENALGEGEDAEDALGDAADNTAAGAAMGAGALAGDKATDKDFNNNGQPTDITKGAKRASKHGQQGIQYADGTFVPGRFDDEGNFHPGVDSGHGFQAGVLAEDGLHTGHMTEDGFVYDGKVDSAYAGLGQSYAGSSGAGDAAGADGGVSGAMDVPEDAKQGLMDSEGNFYDSAAEAEAAGVDAGDLQPAIQTADGQVMAGTVSEDGSTFTPADGGANSIMDMPEGAQQGVMDSEGNFYGSAVEAEAAGVPAGDLHSAIKTADGKVMAGSASANGSKFVPAGAAANAAHSKGTSVANGGSATGVEHAVAGMSAGGVPEKYNMPEDAEPITLDDGRSGIKVGHEFYEGKVGDDGSFTPADPATYAVHNYDNGGGINQAAMQADAFSGNASGETIPMPDGAQQGFTTNGSDFYTPEQAADMPADQLQSAIKTADGDVVAGIPSADGSSFTVSRAGGSATASAYGFGANAHDMPAGAQLSAVGADGKVMTGSNGQSIGASAASMTQGSGQVSYTDANGGTHVGVANANGTFEEGAQYGVLTDSGFKPISEASASEIADGVTGVQTEGGRFTAGSVGADGRFSVAADQSSVTAGLPYTGANESFNHSASVMSAEEAAAGGYTATFDRQGNPNITAGDGTPQAGVMMSDGSAMVGASVQVPDGNGGFVNYGDATDAQKAGGSAVMTMADGSRVSGTVDSTGTFTADRAAESYNSSGNTIAVAADGSGVGYEDAAGNFVEAASGASMSQTGGQSSMMINGESVSGVRNANGTFTMGAEPVVKTASGDIVPMSSATSSQIASGQTGVMTDGKFTEGTFNAATSEFTPTMSQADISSVTGQAVPVGSGNGGSSIMSADSVSAGGYEQTYSATGASMLTSSDGQTQSGVMLDNGTALTGANVQVSDGHGGLVNYGSASQSQLSAAGGNVVVTSANGEQMTGHINSATGAVSLDGPVPSAAVGGSYVMQASDVAGGGYTQTVGSDGQMMITSAGDQSEAGVMMSNGTAMMGANLEVADGNGGYVSYGNATAEQRANNAVSMAMPDGTRVSGTVTSAGFEANGPIVSGVGGGAVTATTYGSVGATSVSSAAEIVSGGSTGNYDTYTNAAGEAINGVYNANGTITAGAEKIVMSADGGVMTRSEAAAAGMNVERMPQGVRVGGEGGSVIMGTFSSAAGGVEAFSPNVATQNVTSALGGAGNINRNIMASASVGAAGANAVRFAGGSYAAATDAVNSGAASYVVSAADVASGGYTQVVGDGGQMMMTSAAGAEVPGVIMANGSAVAGANLEVATAGGGYIPYASATAAQRASSPVVMSMPDGTKVAGTMTSSGFSMSSPANYGASGGSIAASNVVSAADVAAGGYTQTVGNGGQMMMTSSSGASDMAGVILTSGAAVSGANLEVATAGGYIPYASATAAQKASNPVVMSMPDGTKVAGTMTSSGFSMSSPAEYGVPSGVGSSYVVSAANVASGGYTQVVGDGGQMMMSSTSGASDMAGVILTSGAAVSGANLEVATADGGYIPYASATAAQRSAGQVVMATPDGAKIPGTVTSTGFAPGVQVEQGAANIPAGINSAYMVSASDITMGGYTQTVGSGGQMTLTSSSGADSITGVMLNTGAAVSGANLEVATAGGEYIPYASATAAQRAGGRVVMATADGAKIPGNITSTGFAPSMPAAFNAAGPQAVQYVTSGNAGSFAFGINGGSASIPAGVMQAVGNGVVGGVITAGMVNGNRSAAPVYNVASSNGIASCGVSLPSSTRIVSVASAGGTVTQQRTSNYDIMRQSNGATARGVVCANGGFIYNGEKGYVDPSTQSYVTVREAASKGLDTSAMIPAVKTQSVRGGRTTSAVTLGSMQRLPDGSTAFVPGAVSVGQYGPAPASDSPLYTVSRGTKSAGRVNGQKVSKTEALKNAMNTMATAYMATKIVNDVASGNISAAASDAVTATYLNNTINGGQGQGRKQGAATVNTVRSIFNRSAKTTSGSTDASHSANMTGSASKSRSRNGRSSTPSMQGALSSAYHGSGEVSNQILADRSHASYYDSVAAKKKRKPNGRRPMNGRPTDKP